MERLTPALAADAADDFNREHPLPAGFSLRGAGPDDLDAVMDVGLACFATDQPERPKIRHFLSKANAAVVLLLDGATPIGYVHVEGHAGRRNAYLNTIAVLEKYRGRGLGFPLYRFVDVLAHKSGAKSVWAHVAVDNDQALYLLKKNGYIIEKTIDPYYHDDGKAAHILRKYSEVD